MNDLRPTEHSQKHGSRTTANLYIFNQRQKANEAEANKCHAFVDAFYVVRNPMTAKETLIKKLYSIKFHDAPVEKLSISTTDNVNSLAINFSLFNEEKQDYEYLAIRFSGLLSFEMEGVNLGTESNLEIYRFAYIWTDSFIGRFDFLCGFGQPSFAVTFTCETVDLAETKPNHGREPE